MGSNYTIYKDEARIFTMPGWVSLTPALNTLLIISLASPKLLISGFSHVSFGFMTINSNKETF